MAAQMFEGRHLANPDEDLYDQGLRFDVETLLDRRRMLQLMGVTGLSAGLFVVGCGPSGTASPTAGTPAGASSSAAAATSSASTSTAVATSAAATSTAAATTAGTAEECAVIPEETAGPFPGDGSNGPDMLSQSGVVRQDIRSSFGGSTGTAEGVPLTIKLAIQDGAAGCVPLAGAAVYLWHCDRGGRYSLYSDGVTDQNYLRGVQEAGTDGIVTFQSIFPGCYAGRWPHIHLEVFEDLTAASDDVNKIATSQVALTEEASNAAYATDGYSQSVANMQRVSLESDSVFGEDGGVAQLGRMSGSVADGYTVELTVPVRTG